MLLDYARLHDNNWYCITPSNNFSVGIPRDALDKLVEFDPEVKNYVLRWLSCDPRGYRAYCLLKNPILAAHNAVEGLRIPSAAVNGKSALDNGRPLDVVARISRLKIPEDTRLPDLRLKRKGRRNILIVKEAA